MKPFKPNDLELNRLKNRINQSVYEKFRTKPNWYIINQNQTKPNHFLLILIILSLICHHTYYKFNHHTYHKFDCHDLSHCSRFLYHGAIHP